MDNTEHTEHTDQKESAAPTQAATQGRTTQPNRPKSGQGNGQGPRKPSEEQVELVISQFRDKIKNGHPGAAFSLFSMVRSTVSGNSNNMLLSRSYALREMVAKTLIARRALEMFGDLDRVAIQVEQASLRTFDLEKQNNFQRQIFEIFDHLATVIVLTAIEHGMNPDLLVDKVIRARFNQIKQERQEQKAHDKAALPSSTSTS